MWLYELCRFLIAQCNTLIVGFLFDTPPCSASTCPEMRAGEWQFLCAVHDTPKSCCAIDYCCHTLDWATNVVTNPKIFPSRFVVDSHDKNMALKNLVNVFRRLHRIFAHAWFQHRGVFWSLESQSGLYVFFKSVCDVYDLLPAENYKLPPEAEGLDSNAGTGDLGDRNADRRQQPQQQQQMGPISIAKPPSQSDGDDGDYSGVSRTNTRRHIKSSPSTGSAVTTVPEADEDDSADLSHRLGEMRISGAAGPAIGEPELANIPVIVDHRPVAAAEQPLRPSSVIPPSKAATAEPQAEPAGPEADAAAPEPEFASEPEIPPPIAAEPEPEPATAVPHPEFEPHRDTNEPSAATPAATQPHQAEEQSTSTAVGELAPPTDEAGHENVARPPSVETSGESHATSASAEPVTTEAPGVDDAKPPATTAEEPAPSEEVAAEGAVADEPGAEPEAAAGRGQHVDDQHKGTETGAEAAEDATAAPSEPGGGEGEEQEKVQEQEGKEQEVKAEE